MSAITIGLLICTALLFQSRGIEANDQAVRLSFASTFPSSMELIGEAAVELPRRVARATGNEIQFEFNEPGVLVPATETLHAVANGSIASGWGGAGWFADVDSTFSMFSAVPFGPGIGEYMAWMYYGGGLDLAREMFARHDLHNLPCAMIPPEASGWFKQEIRSVADLRGLRMRFFGLGAEVMQKLGVDTRSIAPGDIRQALKDDRIDAAEFSLPAMDRSLGLGDVAGYYYFPGWHQQATLFDLYVNRQVWVSLSDRHRAVIELACGDMVRESIARGEAGQWKAMQAMQASGVQIRRWPHEIIAAMESAWNELAAEKAAANPNFRRVYGSYQTFRQNYAIWRDHGFLK